MGSGCNPGRGGPGIGSLGNLLEHLVSPLMASPRKGIVLKEAQHWNLQHTSIGISDCLYHEPSYGYNTIHSPHRALLDLPADLSTTTHLLLVTGDKKGLSFVLHLCQQFSGDVLLMVRDEVPDAWPLLPAGHQHRAAAPYPTEQGVWGPGRAGQQRKRRLQEQEHGNT